MESPAQWVSHEKPSPSEPRLPAIPGLPGHRSSCSGAHRGHCLWPVHPNLWPPPAAVSTPAATAVAPQRRCPCPAGRTALQLPEPTAAAARGNPAATMPGTAADDGLHQSRWRDFEGHTAYYSPLEPWSSWKFWSFRWSLPEHPPNEGPPDLLRWCLSPANHINNWPIGEHPSAGLGHSRHWSEKPRWMESRPQHQTSIQVTRTLTEPPNSSRRPSGLFLHFCCFVKNRGQIHSSEEFKTGCKRRPNSSANWNRSSDQKKTTLHPQYPQLTMGIRNAKLDHPNPQISAVLANG